jgi:sideroflexin-5
LWEAKRIKEAMIHPVTNEKMFLPGRMSAFVPVNTIPTVGMLLAQTPAQAVFWQWVNQSLNVMCNYVNRSGASIDTSQVVGAYALAVGVSCSIALGARKLIDAGPPWVRRLKIAVPYAAVVTAGAANVAFTRLPEMREGAPITAPDGTPLGTSKAAAKSAVVNTVLSRILLQPIAPMLLPPLMYSALRSVVPLGTVGSIAAQTAFVAGCSGCALPIAIACFPQEMKIATSALEPEFQQSRDATGQPIEYVLCNKGL